MQPLRARFSLDYAATVEWLRRNEPDAVLVNQVELAAPMKGALVDLGMGIPVGVYCHYLPFTFDGGSIGIDESLNDSGLGNAVTLHFLAGLSVADCVFIHSATAAKALSALARHFNLELSAKLIVAPPPRDPNLVSEPSRVFEKKAIYNHRLYAHYGTAKAIELMGALTRTTDVRIVVTDLMGSRSQRRTRLDSSPSEAIRSIQGINNVSVVRDLGNRARYKEFIVGSAFGIAPYRNNCPWSMSVVDCEALGVPVIAPRLGWFAEHLPTDLLFDSSDEAVEIARRLLCDSEFRFKMAGLVFENTRCLSTGACASAIAGAFASCSEDGR